MGCINASNCLLAHAHCISLSYPHPDLGDAKMTLSSLLSSSSLSSSVFCCLLWCSLAQSVVPKPFDGLVRHVNSNHTMSMCLQVARLVPQTLKRADPSLVRRARLGASPHGPCPSQSARRSSQSWLRMRSGKAGPLMAARTSTLPRLSWISTRSTTSRWVLHRSACSAQLLWEQSIFLMILATCQKPNARYHCHERLASCMVALVLLSPLQCHIKSVCVMLSKGCLYVVMPECQWLLIPLHHQPIMLQVIVSEQGGPEETFLVRIKWAATVDIRSLTQFVA